MNLNDLLRNNNIDPKNVLAVRHRPPEAELRRELPLLAAEKPAVFNAYQQTQNTRLERRMQAMVGSGYLASFIGHEPRRALFVGLYSIVAARPLTFEEYRNKPEVQELGRLGVAWARESPHQLVVWFELVLTDFYSEWKGRLSVSWRGEIAFYQEALDRRMTIVSLAEESVLDEVPPWDELVLTWDRLKSLPRRWGDELRRQRAIYYIRDLSDNKGYVGAAYGTENLLGRWRDYGESGHGDNRLLLERDPRNFRFSVLEILKSDAKQADVAARETSWKKRLQTRAPYGLNAN